MKARITEVFDSVQGEGLYLGERQIFVRFFGCNLNCNYCDTPVSRFMEYDTDKLLTEINSFHEEYHSISFTGGEPLLHSDFLKEIMERTAYSGRRNYLETNGTLPGELDKLIHLVDIVAMDIKLPSSTGTAEFWGLHRRFLEIASKKEVFIKTIICSGTSDSDIETALSLIKEVNPWAVLVLQPNSFETAGVLDSKLDGFKELCAKRDITACVIPQMHKAANIR